MKKAKKKAIEKAWIDLVGKENFQKIKYKIDFETGFCEWGGFFKWPDFMDLHTRKDKCKDSYVRPKSLSGIETNNNWISINSEEDFPNEQDELYFVYGPNVSVHQCIYHEGIKDYWLKNFSHWQTIIKPEKPIY